MGLSRVRRSELIEAMVPNLVCQRIETGSLTYRAEHIEGELTKLTDEDLIRTAMKYCFATFKWFFERNTAR